MMKDYDIVLTNGAKVPKSIVKITVEAIEGLWHKDPKGRILVYDLWKLCEDPKYPIFQENLEELISRHLVQENGRVHEAIKNIILCLVQGEGLNITLVDPTDPQQ